MTEPQRNEKQVVGKNWVFRSFLMFTHQILLKQPNEGE
jgi:hypothetical protein